MAAATPTQKRNYTLFVAIAAAIIILGGIFLATSFDLTTPITFEESEGRTLIISELTLAGLLTPEEAVKPDPKLRQSASYAVGEPLALRITTDPTVTEQFTVSVRLLVDNGLFIDLTPGQATFKPGTSTYCCWRVAESGQYTFQIFRPEKIITSLPLLIVPAGNVSQPLL